MLTSIAPPPSVTYVSTLHIISGAINLLLMWCLSGYFLSCICSVPTFGFGSVCGFASLLLVPLGVAEIAIGLWGRSAPREALPTMKWLTALQIASVFVGGFSSAIAGGTVLFFLNQDEVLAYLEG